MALDNTFDFGDAVATGNEPLIAQQIRIAQQKKQLETEMAAAAGQAPPTGQMVSGHYVKPSALQQLTPLLGSALNQFRQQALDKESSDLDRKVAAAKAQVLMQAPGTDAPTQQRMAFLSRLQQIPGMGDLANAAAKDYLINEPDRVAARTDAKETKQATLAQQPQLAREKLADAKRHDDDMIADRQQRAADANDLRATLAAAVRGASGGDKASNYQIVTDGQGGATRVNKLTGEVVPLGSIGREAASITRERQAQGDQIANAQKGLSLTAEARELLPQATGSAAGSLRDTIAGAAGYSTDGAKAAARLDSIAAQLASQVPRLGGSTSDADLKFYKEQVGNLGDRSKPVGTRMAALQQVEKALRRASNPASYASPQGTPPTGNSSNGPSIREAVESAAKQHSNTGKVRTYNAATGMLE